MFASRQQHFDSHAIQRQQYKIALLAGHAFNKNNFKERAVENLFQRTTRRPSSAFLKYRTRKKMLRGIRKVKLTLNAFDRDDELDGEELFFNDDGGELSRKSSKAYSEYKADLIKASSTARRKRIRENNNGVDLNSLFATKMKILKWKKNVEKKKQDRLNVINEAKHLIEEGKIKMELSAEEIENIDVRDQGDLATYTEDALLQRQHIALDKDFNNVIEGWWHDFILPTYDLDGDGNIQYIEYKKMYKTLRLVMRKLFSLTHSKKVTKRLQLEEEVRQDWQSDVGDEADMDLELFHKSIFELVDHWCDDLEVEKYIELTNTLFGVMETLEKRREQKRIEMTKPDYDPLTTTVGVSPIFHVRENAKMYKSIDLSEIAKQKVIQHKWRTAKRKITLGRLLSLGKNNNDKDNDDDDNNKAGGGNFAFGGINIGQLKNRNKKQGEKKKKKKKKTSIIPKGTEHFFSPLKRSYSHLEKLNIPRYCNQDGEYGYRQETVYGYEKDMSNINVYGDKLCTRQTFKYVDSMGGIFSPYRVYEEEEMLEQAKVMLDDIENKKTKKIYVKKKNGGKKIHVMKKYDRLLMKFGVKGL